jgi:hypothetical protein
MIKAILIQPGDRVSVHAHNSTTTRTVMAVGDDYVVVHVCGQIAKIPEHRITGHIAVQRNMRK